MEQHDWSDVVGIPQDDGPSPVAAINYAPQYRDAMDLFRAVIKADERSERALDLTLTIVEINPAHYTAWHYRRLCLIALNKDLRQELDLLDTYAEENPKNYQIWYHRRAIVEQLQDPSRELAFTAAVFEVDAKNYHGWAHRQWVIKTFGLWEGELDYIRELLVQDIRNNSAWNQRWFVLTNGPRGVDADVIQQEIDFAFNAITRAPHNESPWNYLRGLSRTSKDIATPIVKERCLKLLEDDSMANVPFLLALCADLLQTEDQMRARQLYTTLATADPLRSKYWTMKAEKIAV